MFHYRFSAIPDMSVPAPFFSGVVKEYPSIVVDTFHVPSEIYFLSHFHEDHVYGLKTLNPIRKTKIYCSDITRQLLLNQKAYTHIQENLFALQINQTHSVDARLNLTVRLLPAGHCLGSVMFLIDGKNGTILHTGDYREDAREVKALVERASFEHTLRLKTIYLDTTFFSSFNMNSTVFGNTSASYRKQQAQPIRFPTRKAATDSLLREVARWMAQKPLHLHIVYLRCAHKFSYEYLWSILRQRFANKIYVTQDQYRYYDGLPEIQADLTCDPSTTRIHACYHPKRRGSPEQIQCDCIYDAERYRQTRGLPLTSKSQSREVRRLTIHLSAIWWFKRRKSLDVPSQCKHVYVESPESCQNPVMRSFFAAHASPTELYDLILLLRPDNVVPTVVPVADTDGTLDRLTENDLCPTARSDKGDNLVELEVKLQEFLNVANRRMPLARSVDDLFQSKLMDVPVRETRMAIIRGLEATVERPARAVLSEGLKMCGGSLHPVQGNSNVESPPNSAQVGLNVEVSGYKQQLSSDSEEYSPSFLAPFKKRKR